MMSLRSDHPLRVWNRRLIRLTSFSIALLWLCSLGCASLGQQIHNKLAAGLHDEALTIAKAHVRKQRSQQSLKPDDEEAILAAINANFAAAAKIDDPDAYRVFRQRVSDLPGARHSMSKADRAEIEAMLRQAEASKRPQVFKMVQRRATELAVGGDLLDRAMAGEVAAAYSAALRVGSTEALRRFRSAYDGRLDDAMRNQVREEEARLALFGDNKPTNLRAREALITRFEGTEAARDAQVHLLNEQLKLAEARGLPGLRAFIATNRRRPVAEDWVAKARVHEADRLRQQASAIHTIADLKGFMTGCGSHELCQELSADAEARVLVRQLKPVGISRSPHWTKSCWPKPAEEVLKRASSVFCIERKVAKRAPVSSFNNVLYRARSLELRQLLTLYLARRELDRLIETRNTRRLEFFVTKHEAQPITAELAEEARAALQPKEPQKPTFQSAVEWVKTSFQAILEHSALLKSEPVTIERRQQIEASLVKEADRLQTVLAGQMVHLKGLTVRDIVQDSSTQRHTLIAEIQQDFSSLVFLVHAVLPTGVSIDRLEIGSETSVSGRVVKVIYRDELDDFILEIE